MKNKNIIQYNYRKRICFVSGLFLGILVIGIPVLIFSMRTQGRVGLSKVSSFNNITRSASLNTISELLLLPKDQITDVDVGQMNLLCAKGLKGSEDLDIQKCLSTLNKWAEIVKEDTQKRISSFYQNPAKYDNSVNLFKVTNMILTLKEEIGLDYNPDIMKRTTFMDSKDVFIHGCLAGQKKGGCISIPVTCVAVGRRLGYPLKLVLTKEHVFFRWDDGKEKFNMEACCPGCDSRPDEYYMNWPNKLNHEQVKNGCFLRSLTPDEELGLFLEVRGHCLYDEGKTVEAMVMYAHAYQLMPDSMPRLANLEQVLNCEISKFRKANSKEIQ